MKRLLIILMVFVLIFSFTSSVCAESDYEVAEKIVEFVNPLIASNELKEKTYASEYNFDNDQFITREKALSILFNTSFRYRNDINYEFHSKYTDFEKMLKEKFVDVDINTNNAGIIFTSAIDLSLIDGDSFNNHTKFRPNDFIKKDELAKILVIFALAPCWDILPYKFKESLNDDWMYIAKHWKLYTDSDKNDDYVTYKEFNIILSRYLFTETCFVHFYNRNTALINFVWEFEYDFELKNNKYFLNIYNSNTEEKIAIELTQEQYKVYSYFDYDIFGKMSEKLNFGEGYKKWIERSKKHPDFDPDDYQGFVHWHD